MEGRHFFTRDISIDAFEGGPDSFVIRGTLNDFRRLPYRQYLSGEIKEPGTIHNMTVEMEISLPELVILSAKCSMQSVPNEDCREISGCVDRIIGLSIKRGFTRTVRDLLGGNKGCLHITQLVLTMGSAAAQALWAFNSSRGAAERKARSKDMDAAMLVNSCWLWRPDGPYAVKLMGKKSPVITIDGPAGSGKSTIARMLASQLGFTYLDTGAIYRAVALLADEQGIEPDDGRSLAVLAGGLDLELEGTQGGSRVIAGGRDISAEIRAEKISMMASRISALPEVREALLPVQRGFALKGGVEGGVVCEGRDMGTVVFPDAQLKVYLDADVAERARRRRLELESRGLEADYKTIKEEMERRDRQDMERAAAPLKVPEGAVVIDTTGLSIQEVTGAIMRRACNLRESGGQQPA